MKPQYLYICLGIVILIVIFLCLLHWITFAQAALACAVLTAGVIIGMVVWFIICCYNFAKTGPEDFE